MSHPGTQARTTALDLIRPLVQGRTVILTGSAAGSVPMANFLADAGALPTRVELNVTSPDTRGRFAAYEWLIEHPTPGTRERVESLDPAGTALVYAGSFTGAQQFCGRRVIGTRSVKHMDAERKDVQRRLLKLPGDLVSLADGLHHHLGGHAVVQGVPDHGVAMAASHTYLAPANASHETIDELVARLSRECSRAVVSAFNVGLPCTFYGFVTETAVIDFGPVEALVSWDPHDWRIYAPGILRPATLDRSLAESARHVVHDAARLLQEQIGYRGAFGVDGTLTPAGYVIHEINPRVCAGFALLDRLSPRSAPLASIDLVLREMPDALTPLTDGLDHAAAMIANDTTAGCRLWEDPAYTPASAGIDIEIWKQEVRAKAADGRVPLIDLKEATPWS